MPCSTKNKYRKTKGKNSATTTIWSGCRKWVSYTLIGLVSFVILLIIAAAVKPEWFRKVYYFGRVLTYVETAIKGPIMPDMDGLYGIDVSKHQGDIVWSDVELRYNMLNRRININGDTKRQLTFAIAKATEGLTVDDPKFIKNKNGIRSKGLTFGAYHYFSYTSVPSLQAEHFIELAQLRKGDIVPILDIEEDGSLTKRIKNGSMTREDVGKKALEWLTTIEKKLKCKPIIYTSAGFKCEYLNDSVFDSYPLWIAHYQVSEPMLKGAIWQFTELGEIYGIKGDVDVNIFSGSSKDFDCLLLK